MNRGIREWIFSIMSRISIKSGEEVFNSVRGHSARAFEPNKKNPILTQVQITVVPINAETHLVLQQWWMQENFTHIKLVVFQSHPEVKLSMHLSYTPTIPT